MLPLGWEVKFDREWRKYYVDHNTKDTFWEIPLEILPFDWEEKYTNDGRVYYVDHCNQKTTWYHPYSDEYENSLKYKIKINRLQEFENITDYFNYDPNKKTFYWKSKDFSEECSDLLKNKNYKHYLLGSINEKPEKLYC